VELNPGANTGASASAAGASTGTASSSAAATSVTNITPDTAAALGLVSAIAAISNDDITFGNGNGDFVQLVGYGADAGAAAIGGGTAAALAKIDQNSQMSDYCIVYGDGNGDFLSASNTDFSNNTIAFGNGAGDYVSVSDSFSITGGSTSTDNQIIFGNGNNDPAILPSGAGGDTIITGTGNSDTVQVGTHPNTNPDTFGFALGTGATALSQTTVNGALAGDQIAVGNSSGLVLTSSGLGNTLVQDGNIAGITTVNGFITYLTSHGGLTKGDTYTADSGGDTFIATDTLTGKVGGIEIVGAFENNSLSGHILTLGVIGQ
jgi:hypothetical protein